MTTVRLKYGKANASTRKQRVRDEQGVEQDVAQPCDLRTALDALAIDMGGKAIAGDVQADCARGVFGRCYSLPDDKAAAFTAAARALHPTVATAAKAS